MGSAVIAWLDRERARITLAAEHRELRMQISSILNELFQEMEQELAQTRDRLGAGAVRDAIPRLEAAAREAKPQVDTLKASLPREMWPTIDQIYRDQLAWRIDRYRGQVLPALEERDVTRYRARAGKDATMEKTALWIKANCKFAGHPVMAAVLAMFSGMTTVAMTASHRQALIKMIIKELYPLMGKPEFDAKQDELREVLIGSLNLIGVEDPNADVRQMMAEAMERLSKGTLRQQYQKSIDDASRMTQQPPVA